MVDRVIFWSWNTPNLLGGFDKKNTVPIYNIQYTKICKIGAILLVNPNEV
jgi:hypothetical protein